MLIFQKINPKNSYQTPYMRERKKKLYISGSCINCGKERDSEKLLCNVCRDIRAVRSKQKRTHNLKNGLCCKCDTPRMPNSNTVCERHWFEKIANSRTGTPKNGKAIQELLINQNYKCVFTGTILIPGINTSLDHKIPVSKGGSNDISNLQWVEKKVNIWKSDRDSNEFIEMCKLVVSNLAK